MVKRNRRRQRPLPNRNRNANFAVADNAVAVADNAVVRVVAAADVDAVPMSVKTLLKKVAKRLLKK